MLPSELTSLPQWVTWRDQGGKKIPYVATGQGTVLASSTDPATWRTYAQASQFAHQGFIFTLEDGLVGIDLDHCVVDGVISAPAQVICRRLKGYTELSPSKKGLHIIVRGSLQGLGGLNTPEIEIYEQKRYFTVTEDVVFAPVTLPDATKAVLALYNEHRPPPEPTGDQKVPEGTRNQWLIKRGGRYRRAGLSPALLLAALKQDNAAFCNPPLPDTEVVVCARSAARYVPTEDIHLTVGGNAIRLVRRFGENIRYCPTWRGWLHWNGHHWERDAEMQVRQLVREVVLDIYAEIASEPDKDRRKRLVSWASRSDSKVSRLGAQELAKQEVLQDTSALDNHPYLLNIASSTLVLEADGSTRLRPGERGDFLTQHIDATYNPNAETPLWEEFLERVLPNEDVRGFVQRAAGYSLTGSTEEQCFFFLYGTGANGKSTFIETLMAIWGEYAQRAPLSLLASQRRSGASPELARLKGCRMVVASELQEGLQLDEARVKDLTGSDTISARQLYQAYEDFRPTHKLWLCGNHKPTIAETSEAIWRRVMLIPFEEYIPPAEQDKHFPSKLLAEKEGILAWAVRGYQEWRRMGLAPPEIVKEAIAQYRGEEDIVAGFVEECCVEKEGAKARSARLKEVWGQYCRRTRVPKHIKWKQCHERLEKLGFWRVRDTHGWYYAGLEIQVEGLQEDGGFKLAL